MRRAAAAWGLEWAVGLALWFVFAGSISWHELLVGAPAAALGASASRLVWNSGALSFRGRGRDLATLRYVPRYVLTGTWEILAVLWRQVVRGEAAPSLVLAAPMDVGGAGPADDARRALAIAYTTATPNFLVLGVDRERGLIVYHQLQGSDIPEMTRRLGVKP